MHYLLRTTYFGCDFYNKPILFTNKADAIDEIEYVVYDQGLNIYKEFKKPSEYMEKLSGGVFEYKRSTFFHIFDVGIKVNIKIIYFGTKKLYDEYKDCFDQTIIEKDNGKAINIYGCSYNGDIPDINEMVIKNLRYAFIRSLTNKEMERYEEIMEEHSKYKGCRISIRTTPREEETKQKNHLRYPSDGHNYI